MLKRLSGILLVGAMLTSPALSETTVVYGAAEQFWAINGLVDSEGKLTPSCNVSTNWPDPDAEHLAYVELVTIHGPKDSYNGWIQVTVPHLNISSYPDGNILTVVGTRKTGETNARSWNVTMKKASGNPDMLIANEFVTQDFLTAAADGGVLYIFKDSKNEISVDLTGFLGMMAKMSDCTNAIDKASHNDFAPGTKDQERLPQTNPDGSTNRPLDTPA